MPTYSFTSPEGKIYDIEGPEGSTAEQAYGILQQGLAASAAPAKEKPGLMEDIGTGVKSTVLKGMGALDKGAVALSDAMPDWLPGRMTEEERQAYQARGADFQGQGNANAPQRWTGMLASGLTYAPMGAAAPLVVAGTEGTARTQALLDEGVDAPTANTAGAIEGGLQGAVQMIPGGNLAWGAGKAALLRSGAIASGKSAVIGAGQTGASGLATSEALKMGGYPELAGKYEPTPEGMLHGALFQAGAHVGGQLAHRAPSAVGDRVLRAAEDVKYGASAADQLRAVRALSPDARASRMAELDRISKGTPDSTVTGPDGNPVVIPGERGRFFTEAEQREWQEMKSSQQAETAAKKLGEAKTVEEMIPAAQDWATRPADTKGVTVKPSMGGGTDMRGVESEAYQAADLARVEKLRESIDAHTALTAEANAQANETAARVARDAAKEQLMKDFPGRGAPARDVNALPEVDPATIAAKQVKSDEAANLRGQMDRIPLTDRTATDQVSPPPKYVDLTRMGARTAQQRLTALEGESNGRVVSEATPEVRSPWENTVYPTKLQAEVAMAKARERTTDVNLRPERLSIEADPAGGFRVMRRDAAAQPRDVKATTPLHEPGTLEIVPHPDGTPTFAIRKKADFPYSPDLQGNKRVDTTPSTDPVDLYVAAKRKENTPSARAFIGEFDAGRIQRTDVMKAMSAAQRAHPTVDQNMTTDTGGAGGMVRHTELGPLSPRGPAEAGGSMTTRGEEIARSWLPKGATAKPRPVEPTEPGPGPGEPVEPVGPGAGKGGLTFDSNSPALRKAVLARDLKGILTHLAGHSNPLFAHIGAMGQKYLTAKGTPINPHALPAGGGAAGSWHPVTGQMSFANAYRGNEHTAAHETAHALTVHAIRNPTPENRPYVNRLRALRDQVYAHAQAREFGLVPWEHGGDYGVSKRNQLEEFVAEGLTNPEFQKKLMLIKWNQTSAWSKFVKGIADVLGIPAKQHTAFTELLQIHEKLVTQKTGRLHLTGEALMREAAPPPDGIGIHETPRGFEARDAEGKRVGYLHDNLERGQAEQIDENANIDMVHVDREHRGTGVGRALYDAFHEKHGGRIAPSGKTTADAWKQWQRNYPDKVEGFVQQEAARILDGADPHMVLGNITDPKVAQRVHEAVSEGKSGALHSEEPVSRKDMHFTDVTKRDPVLEEAAKKVQSGELTREQYGRMVDERKPVEPFETVPEPATVADLERGLNTSQQNKIGAPTATLKAGDPVKLRLDIPAYSKHGVWAVSVHPDGGGFAGGGSVGYESAAIANGVRFGMDEGKALDIAAGKGKSPIATMKGAWEPTTPEAARAEAQTALHDPAWRQVGMDPTRHGYFYDRETMQPVEGADRVVQVGPLVMAKNVSYSHAEGALHSEEAPPPPPGAPPLSPEAQRGANEPAPRALHQARTFAGRAAETWRQVANTLLPMSTGSAAAQVIVKKYANAERLARYQWQRFDTILKGHYKPEQLKDMWVAADEENLIRSGHMAAAPDKGLARLSDDQRATVEVLHQYGEELLQRARAAGMFEGEGLPYWTPRIAVMIDSEGAYRPRDSTTVGRNVVTTAPSLKERKYLLKEDTEAAMKGVLGDDASLVQDIRTMPLAMARLERAIAGRELVNSVREAGEASGQTFVTDRERAGFAEVKLPGMRGKPLFVAKEFEGPVQSVMYDPPGVLYRGFTALKEQSTGLIMYSPLIHNAVIFGKALPAVNFNVVKLAMLYNRGYKLRTGAEAGYGSAIANWYAGRPTKGTLENPIMSEAIANGLAPIGRNGSRQDITGVVDDPTLKPGQGLKSQLIGGAVGLVHKGAGESTKRGLDAFGELWHSTLLWDRVADVQIGLYADAKAKLLPKLQKRGMNAEQADRAAGLIAAHMANRYAGALPAEVMSQGMRKLSNVLLFSRSFTLGNIALFKDGVRGMPSEVRAQMTAEFGKTLSNSANAVYHRKAISTLVADIGAMYVINSLIQDAVDQAHKEHDWSDLYGAVAGIAKDVWGGYQTRGAEAKRMLLEHPKEVAAHPFDFAHSLFSNGMNEPGKEARIRGPRLSDGTLTYFRSPFGKTGEDLEGWLSDFGGTLWKKLGSTVRPAIEVALQAKGSPIDGKHLWAPSDDLLAKIGKGITHIVAGMVPVDDATTAAEWLTGAGLGESKQLSEQGKEQQDLTHRKLLLPLLSGVTVSKGWPGGPEGGLMNKIEHEHRSELSATLPEVKKLLKTGDDADHDRAVEIMRDDLKMTSSEIKRTIQFTTAPMSRFNSTRLKRDMPYMSEADKTRLETMQNER